MAVRKLLQKVAQVRADHHERHRTTGFEFALADRVTMLDAERWDRLANGASFFLSRGYLEAAREFGPPEIASRYALIADAGRPVAIVAAQLVTLEGGQLAAHEDEPPTKLAARAVRGIRRRALQQVRRRVLVCGNLLSWGAHGVAFAADEDPARLWPAVAEALYRIRNAEKLVGQTDYVMVKDIPAGWAGDARPLERFSYRRVETDPDMVLELPESWRSFDDYLAGLNTKYRKAAKTIVTDVTAAGCDVVRLENLEPHADVLDSLYRQVHDRASVRPTTLPAMYLPALARVAGPERFRCTALRQAERIVGFVTTLKDGEAAIGYYLGLDYAVNATAPIYFRLLQAVVADAIDLGCRRVSLGRTALEPKARLGARPVPMAVWMRHRLPLLNAIVRPLLAAIPHDEAPERKVMK